MKKYKCLVSYDGTNFAGFQIQKNAPTIQEILQKAFAKRFQKYIEITGASRTDAGVHALGQVIHFSLEEIKDFDHFLHQLNCILPKEIRLISIEEVSENFHSRYCAVKKTYYYFLSTGKYLSPFDRLYHVHVSPKIDISLMKEASKVFIGTHDFRAFAHQADKGCAKNKPIKTIYRFDWTPISDGYRIEIEGNGFLHKMVRNLVGLLIDVGMKTIPLEKINQILASCDRKQAGQTAPAHGLFLAKIDY